MEIRILGSVFLLSGERQYVPSSRRVTSLLSLLALSPGRPVPADRIEDELWSGRRLSNARNALQANVGRLRKFLVAIEGPRGEDMVRTVPGGYVLDVAPLAVDAQLFLGRADTGARLLHDDPAMAVVELEQALSLWRGPALMDAGEGPRIRLGAAHLEERRITAYEDLLTAQLSLEAQRVCVPELRQAAAEHPERERLGELLMITLYRAGRQAEALDVFHGTRRRLAGDLGLEPGPGLHRVYEAILRQDETLDQPRYVRADERRLLVAEARG